MTTEDDRDDDDSSLDRKVPEDTMAWRQWPIASVVAKRLGITRKEVQSMVDAEELVRYRGRDNTWRFDPKDIDAIIQSSRLAARDITAAEIEPVVATGERQGRSFEAAAMATLIGHLTKSAEQSQAHLDKMMALFTAPATAAFEVLEKTVKRLVDQNDALHTQLQAQRAATEQATAEGFYRELAAAQYRESEKRRQQVTELIMQKAAPVLMAKAMGLPVDVASLMGKPAGAGADKKPTNGHNGPSVEQQAAVHELLCSLSPEILAGLGEIDGIFSERQKELVKIITGAAKAEPVANQTQTANTGEHHA